MAATYVLTINGTPRKWGAGSLNIQEPANGIRTLQCEIISLDASVRPTRFQTVILTENGTRIYGGIIVRAEERGVGELGIVPITTRISCQDYNQNAARRRINETFPAQTLKARLQALVTNYFGALGVTLDAGQVTGPTIDARQYSWAVGTKGTDVLTETVTLASAAGATDYIWRIDYNNVLSVFTPPTAPFSITTANRKAIGDVQPTPTLSDTYANTIICNGVLVSQTQRIETFAANGVQTVFTPSFTIVNNYGYVIYDDGVNPPVYELLGTFPATWILDLATNTITDTGTGVTGYRTFPAPTGSTISLIFNGTSTPAATAVNAGQVAANGIWEDVISPQNVLDTATAQALAEAELEQRVVLPRTVQYKTYELGIQPAMFQTITVAERNLSGTFLILNVNTDEDGTTRQLLRTVTAVDTTKVRGLTHDLYLRWLGAGDTNRPSTATQIASPTAISGLAHPPYRSVQFDGINGAFDSTRDVSIDKDDTGDVYGVEIAPARFSIILDDDEIPGSPSPGPHVQLAIGNRAAGLDQALTLWQTNAASPGSSDNYIEADGSINIYSNNEINVVGGNTDIGVNDQFTEFVKLRAITQIHGVMPNVRHITGNTTLDSAGVPDYAIFHESASNHTVTLTAAPSPLLFTSTIYGRRLTFMNGDAGGTLTIDGNGTNINTAGTLVLQPGQGVEIQFWGVVSPIWRVVNGIGNIAVGGGGASGDVVGPSSSVDSEFALFNSTTGKLIKRATGTGFAYATSGVYSVVTLASDLVLAGGVLSTQAGIRKAVVSFTDAQVKALPTTSLTVVPAPGAGFRIVPIQCDVRTHLLGAYTNHDAAGYAVLAFGTDEISNYIGNDAGTTPVLADFTSLFNTNTKSYTQLVPYTRVTTPVASEWGNAAVVKNTDYENVALKFLVSNGGSGNFTGGNAGNVFELTQYYAVQPV